MGSLKMNVLTDSFDRQFEYLRLSITDVCNYSCQYCLPDGYQNQTKSRFLSLPEISQIIGAFAQLGTRKIRITGGEPSLRVDLPKVIKIARDQKGIEKVALTSNGYKLKKLAQRWADAGLDAVNISVDSFDPKQFNLITGADDLKVILEGVDKALEVGLQVKLNLVFMRQYNGKALQQVLSYIKDKAVTFRFIELMQTGNNSDFFDKQHISGKLVQNELLLQGFSLIQSDRLAGPEKVYTHPNYAGKIGLIMPYDQGFCDTCNRLRVSAIGKVHLCLFADAGYDLRWALSQQENNPKQQQLVEHLQSLMPLKKQTHYLQDNQTGATTHLAMLGG